MRLDLVSPQADVTSDLDPEIQRADHRKAEAVDPETATEGLSPLFSRF